MADQKYDLVVIGSGPAGEAAAMSAAKKGMRVAVIEKRPAAGGNCTHKGTIPSKALRHAVKQLMRYNTQSVFRALGEPRRLTFPQVMRTVNKVINYQVEMHTAFYARNRVELIFGEARFRDAGTLEVLLPDGATETIAAEKFVIATGSRPYRPGDVDFSHPRIYDSDTILEMQHTPHSIMIYGAGVIGCEYASIFAGLGVKVDLINTRGSLLEFLDDEISDALSYHLRDMGVTVRHKEEYARVVPSDTGVIMEMQSGKRIHADALLWSNGRTGNTRGLGLENIGLEANHRGQLAVDEHYCTEVENIYAVGDVIGWPSLASASYDQGRAVAAAIAGRGHRIIEDAPTGIYTLPEISSVGKTESELTDAKVPYEVGRALFKHTARAQISGERVGMLKILFHIDTHEILGIHCFGAEAAEIVHIGQAIMKQPAPNNVIDYFVNTTFNYPTMAEAYRSAALDGLNRVMRL
ncbi:Si-specific NAD(P)(+) transhydrogenase [Microbulbifer thermotolerans]|uniref:Soluble pyridine nucleotide transhydrogenase n=1 Tax=Microbulbifer thermotolerans TaxID=252514 RepID=A0A143HM84_MICTH|nr:Si-specific NAD(P)(+) transhydrogenase [Microbulbifer thermotolerans]AMX02627.1 NAD(P)(+) transhydrogenase [Microbulbifer thermotolerans]MCX2779777.1 Si-specific NAD(P)(+) transhydrogenase [Microbulbifer thermotolerans]MCX2782291.1 Si-specific NAD(P)(+) transhydrogenase [Microbulbifer thermotolerans]MCX2794445.1 Si-specific NAD(P)(+) transhydrogenase [Microbulbifer thermotolerans]MCX2800444.1 Si-specific NAD(P)(+) transhydrogenase [Microbulbifer thermotolerans]